MRSPTLALLLVTTSLTLAGCTPPPVAPGTATIAVETKDDGEALGTAFRLFAKKHGLMVAEADIGGDQDKVRSIRRRDAISGDMQIHSGNASSPHITVVTFYRGGLTYKIAPATEDDILTLARAFCQTISKDPSVVSVRAARGSLMLDQIPPDADCTLPDDPGPLLD